MGNVLTFVRDGLTSMMSGLGTARDKAASVEFSEPHIDERQLINAYRGSWMARKIVDIPALDSCRSWRAWQAKARQIERIEGEEKRLNVKVKVLEARRKARLFGGAAIYMDLGDEPSQPVRLDAVAKGSIRFLTVLTPRQLVAGEIETDPLSEFYGKPKVYSLTSTSGTVDIHPSRLTIFVGADNPEPDYAASATSAGWGDSALLAVFEAVRQAESAAANVGSLIFEANVDVITMNGLMDHVGTPDGERKVTERYRLAAEGKGNIRTLILDGNEKYERKQITFATLPDLIDRFNQNAAGAADIPMTRFFGMSPGGLNASGESDLRNYYDRIAAAQELEMQPAMTRLDECIIRSATGRRDEAIHYVWNPLWQMSEKEKAEIFDKKATAARTIAGKGKEQPLIQVQALSEALTNELVEDGSLAGLEAAVDKFGPITEVPASERADTPEAGAAEEGEAAKQSAADAAPRTLYVSRKLVNATEFMAWAKSQGFETTVPADELHVTVLYSRQPVDWMKMGENWSSDRKSVV